MDVRRVVLSSKAEKNLLKIPDYIILKLQSWIELYSKNTGISRRAIEG